MATKKILTDIEVDGTTTTKGLTMSALGGFGSGVLEFQTETGSSTNTSTAHIYTYAGTDYNTAMIFGTQAKLDSGNEFILPSFRVEEESNDVYFYQGIEVTDGVKITSGTSSQFLKADGSLDSTVYTGDQDLSGYLLNTSDTLTGTLDVVGSLSVTDTLALKINASSQALQRADSRVDDTNYARMYWYGKKDDGATSNYRSAWYDGSSYIDVTAESGGVTFDGNVISTYDGSDTNTGAYGIDRTLSGLTANVRGYRDNTIITAPGNSTVSHAGIDIKTQMTQGTFDHVTMFQGRTNLDNADVTDFEGLYMGGLSFANTSNVTNYVGVTVENPTAFSGVITNFIGTKIKAPTRTGGTITNFYGLKIEDNVSATNKWAIYSDDDSVNSKMLGQLESGDITVQNTGTSASLNLNSSSTDSGGNYIHAKKSDGSNQWVLGSNSGSDDRVTLKQYNAANIVISTSTADAMTINSSGHVGMGDGTNGYFFSDTDGRTAFGGGNFYIQTSVGTYYNYATNQFHGNTSGDVHYFRGNLVTGNDWSISTSGLVSATKFYVPTATATTTWAFHARNSANTADSGIHFDSGSGEVLLRDSANALTGRLRSSGNSYFNGGSLGIGTTSPDTKLDVVSGLNNGIRVSGTDTTSNWRDIGIRSYVSQAQADALTDHTYLFTTSPTGYTDQAFQRYGGTVIQCRDDYNSNFAIRMGNGTGLATAFNLNASGVATFNNTVTATNFILSSDKRLKNNVEEVDNKHIDVNWKTFEMNSNQGQKRYGVIAQELEEVHPEFVRTNDEGMKSVAYVDLLIAKNAELEARLERLEKLLENK